MRWKKSTACCPQAHRPHTSWSQKVDDVDSWLLYQSEECPRTDHTFHNPFPHPFFKISFHKRGSSGLLSISGPCSLLGLAINAALSFTTTWLYFGSVSGLVWFGNTWVRIQSEKQSHWEWVSIPGTSLVAQWIRICLPMQGKQVRFQGGFPVLRNS